MPKPSLQTLEVFVAVARRGNFRRAAADRDVTPSALSHVIRGLERTLGVRLFHRTSRSVALTEPGRQLLERIAPALDDLGQALDDIAAYRTRPSGRLRLNDPRIVTELVFEPIVASFLKAYPDIQLEIVTTDGLIDILAEGFDAGIRRDRRLAPGRPPHPRVARLVSAGSPVFSLLLRSSPSPAAPARLHRLPR